MVAFEILVVFETFLSFWSFLRFLSFLIFWSSYVFDIMVIFSQPLFAAKRQKDQLGISNQEIWNLNIEEVHVGLNNFRPSVWLNTCKQKNARRCTWLSIMCAQYYSRSLVVSSRRGWEIQWCVPRHNSCLIQLHQNSSLSNPTIGKNVKKKKEKKRKKKKKGKYT